MERVRRRTRLARRIGADVELVQVESDPVDADVGRERLAAEVERRGPFDVGVTPTCNSRPRPSLSN